MGLQCKKIGYPRCQKNKSCYALRKKFGDSKLLCAPPPPASKERRRPLLFEPRGWRRGQGSALAQFSLDVLQLILLPMFVPIRLQTAMSCSKQKQTSRRPLWSQGSRRATIWVFLTSSTPLWMVFEGRSFTLWSLLGSVFCPPFCGDRLWTWGQYPSFRRRVSAAGSQP